MKKIHEPEYWNHTGKYQEEYNALWDRLIPANGESKTTKGELLRCASRIYYDIYNNGGCNLDSDYFTYMRMFLRYRVPDELSEIAREFTDVPKDPLENETYLILTDRFMDALMEHLIKQYPLTLAKAKRSKRK